MFADETFVCWETKKTTHSLQILFFEKYWFKTIERNYGETQPLTMRTTIKYSLRNIIQSIHSCMKFQIFSLVFCQSKKKD